MVLTQDKKSLVGLAHATHPDPFQCGREAAQNAKRLIPDGPLDLVIAFAPEGPHFSDFVEGVRLVTGEETLLGVPVSQMMSTGLTRQDSCIVLIFQAASYRFFLGSAINLSKNTQSTVTRFFTSLKNTRGNMVRQYPHRSILIFNQDGPSTQTELAYEIGAELGLEPFLLGISATIDNSLSGIVCQNKTLTSGLVGLECLSRHPFGLSTVNLGAFPPLSNVGQEAGKVVLREAIGQIKSRTPLAAMLFINSKGEKLNHQLANCFEGAHSIAPDLPIAGIKVTHLFSRSAFQPLTHQEDTLTAMVIPQ